MIFIRGLGMFEGVGEDSRHSSRIMHLLECVWLPLHVHLGGHKLVRGSNDIYKFMALSPKDYYLIPSNNAKNLFIVFLSYCID